MIISKVELYKINPYLTGEDIKVFDIQTNILEEMVSNSIDKLYIEHEKNIFKQLTGVDFSSEQVKAVRVLFEYYSNLKESQNRANVDKYKEKLDKISKILES